MSRAVLDPGFVDARLDITPWPIRVGSGGVSLVPVRRTEGVAGGLKDLRVPSKASGTTSRLSTQNAHRWSLRPLANG